MLIVQALRMYRSGYMCCSAHLAAVQYLGSWAALRMVDRKNTSGFAFASCSFLANAGSRLAVLRIVCRAHPTACAAKPYVPPTARMLQIVWRLDSSRTGFISKFHAPGVAR